MYRILSPRALGVTGRQSEIIELALTYNFGGLDIDIGHFRKQVELRGLDHAARYIRSANLKIGAFDLPVRWQGEEDLFNQDMTQLPQLLEWASAIKAKTCFTTVMPASDERPYHENFEFHRQRITQIAEALSPHDFRLGLAFLAPAHYREGRQYQFISSPDALLTLMKTTVASNLGVLVDLWHWRVGGGAIEQFRELSPEQIVMVRAADVPQDVPMEKITERERLMPGATGVVDTVAAFRLLEEIGYRGPVAPYPNPSCLKGKTRDQIVQLAAESIDTLLKEAKTEGTEKLTAAAG